ncbi:MAG: hypothetical protein C4297_06275 [Gemmataceae bacterium]
MGGWPWICFSRRRSGTHEPDRCRCASNAVTSRTTGPARRPCSASVPALVGAAVAISALTGCGPSLYQRVYQLNHDGVALLHRGQPGLAQEQFRLALALDAEQAVSWYNYATAAHYLGDLPTAEHAYRQALEKVPDLTPARHGLAILLWSQGRSDEAEQLIVSWVRAHPDSADAQAQYGWLLRQRGDLPAAQAVLQHALQLDPGNVRALIELGILYERYRYPDRARQLYERALARDPTQMEAAMRLARLPPRAR